MITSRRREDLGEPMRNMFRVIKRMMDGYPDIKIIYPIHMNHVVREAENEIRGECERIRIVDLLDVLDFGNAS